MPNMFEIFQYDFMLRAFGAGLMIGVLAPAIGVFLVVKRYSLLADTLAHVSLVGVAACGLIGMNPLVGAMTAAVLGSLGIEELRARKQLFGESALALMLSGSLALAIILFSLSRTIGLNLISVLFGSITTVTAGDLWVMGSVGIVAVILIALTFKKLFLVSYDEELARASGLRTRWFNALLVILAAITVSLSIRIVGTLLIGALMVIPVLTATQLKLSFLKTYVVAIVCSVVSVVVGLTLSFYANLPSGGTIVLMALSCFLLSLLVSKQTVRL